MIPVVDIGSYVGVASGDCGQGGDLDTLAALPEVKETAGLLHDAICEHGFCFLQNHGVPQSMVDDVQSSTKAFFQLPVDVKRRFARPPKGNHGWVSIDQENLNPEGRSHTDLKESFRFLPCEEGPWPSEDVPEMEKHFRALFPRCRQMTNCVLDLLGIALGFEDLSFLRKCHSRIGQEGSYTCLRSLYYPAHTMCKEGQIHCGEHSDYDSISLLFQDDIGGLQILGKDGQYRDVQPVSGAVLLNMGDLMQRWTSDRYPATKHRVIVPAEAVTRGLSRQSLAFFVQPDNDTVISCLDGSDKYPPITSLDYLMYKYSFIY